VKTNERRVTIPCMKKQLIVPKFKNEDEERDFWAKLDISEYLEASDFHRVSFPNLKPTDFSKKPVKKSQKA
jgi:hypothetical protein